MPTHPHNIVILYLLLFDPSFLSDYLAVSIFSIRLSVLVCPYLYVLPSVWFFVSLCVLCKDVVVIYSAKYSYAYILSILITINSKFTETLHDSTPTNL